MNTSPRESPDAVDGFSVHEKAVVEELNKRVASSRDALRRSESECIEELENCSLQENEKCNCLWQVIRALHGVFHWLNTLTCIRHGRSCKDKRKDQTVNVEEGAIGLSSISEEDMVEEKLDSMEKFAQ